MLVTQISSVPIGKGAGPVSSASQLHPLQQDCCQLRVYGHTGQMRSSLSCSFLPKARPMASVQLKVTQDIRRKVRSAVWEAGRRGEKILLHHRACSRWFSHCWEWLGRPPGVFSIVCLDFAFLQADSYFPLWLCLSMCVCTCVHVCECIVCICMHISVCLYLCACVWMHCVLVYLYL